MSRYTGHSIEELEALLKAGPDVLGVQEPRIRAELASRRALAELTPEERLEVDRAPAGKRPEDRMNKTEARFARHLDVHVREGRYTAYVFEHLKVRVGVARDWYTVDFVAVRPDGTLDAYEVKGGHIREDAVEKFKAAALIYPWAHWRMVQWKGGRWRIVHDYPRRITTEEG